MESRGFLQHTDVSALSLGGGGIGQVWGPTSRIEAVATVIEATNCGINWIDGAPSYGDGEAEAVIADAFQGTVPEGVRISTKCKLLTGSLVSFADRLHTSIENSLEQMHLNSVDLLILHNMITEPSIPSQPGCSLDDYHGNVIPALMRLKEDGIITAWGITGIGVPSAISKAISEVPKPDAIQVVTNALDSAGDIQGYHGLFTPRLTIQEANEHDVAVMGIRAVQGGALTSSFDRLVDESSADMMDYIRAADFRKLAKYLGITPAVLAHRYALSLDGVATIVLGVKNRYELYECLEAEETGRLDDELMSLVDESIGGAESI